jgi:hypothetical protein
MHDEPKWLILAGTLREQTDQDLRRQLLRAAGNSYSRIMIAFGREVYGLRTIARYDREIRDGGIAAAARKRKRLTPFAFEASFLLKVTPSTSSLRSLCALFGAADQQNLSSLPNGELIGLSAALEES